MTQPSTAGAKSPMRSPTQQTTPHQSRGSATYPDATKRVMTARKSAIGPRNSDSERHEPRGTSKQRRNDSSALPTRPVTARNWNHDKSKPGGPECTRRSATRRKHPANSQSSATQPEATKRKPTTGTTHSPMERCNASGAEPDQNNASNTAPRPRYQQATLPKPRSTPPASGCHEARPARMPKRIDEAALPNQDAGFRASPAGRPPLRTGHGTTSSGCRHQKHQIPKRPNHAIWKEYGTA